jgi:hypothetical protein
LSISASAIARLGDYADDVARPRPALAVEDDGGARPVALQPRQREAQDVGVAAKRGAAFDETVDERARVGPGFPPQAGARRNEADDASLPLDHDRAQIVFLLGGKRFVQRRAGLRQDEPALRHVLACLTR